MKYAVLGAGAMGSIIGATLAKSGQKVILVDPYKEHMDKIKNEGLKFTIGQTTEIIKMETYTDPDDAGQVDVIILLVKGYNSEAAVQGARGLFGANTYICSLQNGLGNTDILAGIFPKEKILHGVIRVAGVLEGPGVVSGKVGGDVAIYLGSLVKEETAAQIVQIMANHLTVGGLKTQFKSNVEQNIWDKAVMNVCANAACGVLRLKVRDYFNHPEGKRLMQDIAQEAVAVAEAKGIMLDYEFITEDIATAVSLAGEHYPSMAQDMRNKRKTEIDTLNGAIVKYGRELGVSTPANDYLTRFVKIIEDNYDTQF